MWKPSYSPKAKKLVSKHRPLHWLLGENNSKICLQEEVFRVQMCVYTTEQLYFRNVSFWTAVSPAE